MVRTDAGWRCPQCGSVIVGGQPAKAAAQTHDDTSEQTHAVPAAPRA